MKRSTGSDWMSTAAAAQAIGVTARTLYRLIDLDDLPAYRIGRVIRLRRSDVDEWLEGRRIRPPDESTDQR